MKHNIKGTVHYQNIETGFWGIVTAQSDKWMIVNMPEQLKQEGHQVEVTIEELDAMSTSMWGKPARILSFET